MFFILATAAFFAAIVLLLVYTIQINRTKRDYLGRNAVRKITEQAVESSLKTQTHLTCDYCGCVIDTTRYKTCPQCGATYGEDREWKNRIGVNRDRMEELIASGIGRNRDELRALNAGRIKKARTHLTALGLVTAFFVAMMVIGLSTAAKEKNRSEKIGSDYLPAGYSFTETLIGESGIDRNSIKKLVIAGSFGSGIDMENAAYIGLIPQDLLPVAGTAGNASLAGATLYALDTGFGDRLKSFCGRAKALELSETPEFSARYISYMGF